MQHLVLVQSEPNNGYRAKAVGFPEITAVAETEQQAVEQVSRQLEALLNTSRLVVVDIHASQAVNPLVKLAGIGHDDPDFDMYLEEIQRYRQEVEARECSNSSSTPTT
jgi:hypothetical protein